MAKIYGIHDRKVVKNYVYNSAMDHFQRGLTAQSINTTQQYRGPDRWLTYVSNVGTGTPNVYRSSDVPSGIGVDFSCRIAFQRNGSAINSVFYQRIESSVVKELSNKAVSLSYWLKPEVGTTIYVVLASYATIDAGGVGSTILAQSPVLVTTGVWQRLTLENIILPDVSNGLGVYIISVAAAGSDASERFVGLTGVQLEEGATCSSTFQRAGVSAANELLLCQRYFAKSFRPSITPANNTGSVEDSVHGLGTHSTGVNANTFGWNFPVIMRTSLPTVTIYNPFSATPNTFSLSGAGANAVNVYGLNPIGITLRNTNAVSAGSQINIAYTADAEI